MNKKETLDKIKELGPLAVLHGPSPEITMRIVDAPVAGVVNIDIIHEWFKAVAFAVGAGSQLCPKPLVQAGDFTGTRGIAREFARVVAEAQENLRRVQDKPQFKSAY